MRISDWSSDVCSSDLIDKSPAVAASRNRPYGDAPHVRCLIPCPPTRMRVRYHPARKPRDPGITRCDLWRIAEVEHRRALLGPLLAFVEGAEQLVPGEVGDAEIARFVMEVIDRKSVVWGMRGPVRVDHGDRRILKKTK